MKKNALILKVVIFMFLTFSWLIVYSKSCCALEADLSLFFYKPSYFEKLSSERYDISLKSVEFISPEAYKVMSVLKKLPSVLKPDGMAAVKSIGVAINFIKGGASSFNVYIVINAANQAAGNILSCLSTKTAPAGNKVIIENGITGFICRGDFVFITNDEKITDSEASKLIDRFAPEFYNAAGLIEKMCVYKTENNRSYAIGYINENMLSLLDKVIDKLDKIELEVIDEDRCDVNFCFIDNASLAADYEVLLGYKDILAGVISAIGEMEKNGKKAVFGRSIGGRADVISCMGSIAKKITFKLNAAKLIFSISGIKKYSGLNAELNSGSVTGNSPAAQNRSNAAENPRNSCERNMKTIEGAVELFLMEATKVEKPIDIEILVKKEYLRKTPVCPEGGFYSLELENADLLGPYKVKCGRHGRPGAK